MDTERLVLEAITGAEAVELYPILSDPAGWWYEAGGRHTDLETTRSFVERASARWSTDGLSYWIVRRRADLAVVGLGGVQRHRTGTWNLSYRVASAEQGNGYAIEFAAVAMRAALATDPTAPIIAWIAEHNIPSRRVAERLGFTNCGLHTDLNDGQERIAYADRTFEPVLSMAR